MKDERKRMKREYRESPRPAGVFQIRNTSDERVFVASALDLHGVMNRHRFELEAGSHPNRRLQADWDALGAARFAFEILDQLVPRDGPGDDPRAEITFLEDLWLERLEPFGERGYNEPKAGKEEKMRRIAAARLKRE